MPETVVSRIKELVGTRSIRKPILDKEGNEVLSEITETEVTYREIITLDTGEVIVKPDFSEVLENAKEADVSTAATALLDAVNKAAGTTVTKPNLVAVPIDGGGVVKG